MLSERSSWSARRSAIYVTPLSQGQDPTVPAAPYTETFGPDGPNGLSAVRTRSGACLVVYLDGVLDTVTAPGLTALLGHACVARDVDAVVIDVRGVTFFGTAGLTCLDAAARAAAGREPRWTCGMCLRWSARCSTPWNSIPTCTSSRRRSDSR
ncbi:STAS domain-containing protein [Cryptosporangium sp. NPDC048952]|uniref:STAS domain-containing protein n=1 Tax=Cryptosporangium sp. NPDC048952 TaxID=3363961 RepID=UPI0037164E3C